jgi:hypothetical protein
VHGGDVIPQIVLHDEPLLADVAAERPDVEVDSVLVLLQSVFGTQRFATYGALPLLIQTTGLAELNGETKKENKIY